MTYEQNCPALVPGYILHLAETLLLELHISHCQHLVHNQNLRLQVSSYGKSQAHVHPARVVLHRCVKELFSLRECDDLIELAIDLGLAHSEDGTIEVNIFPPR